MYYTWYNAEHDEGVVAGLFLEQLVYVIAVLVFSTAAFTWSLTPEK